jgi:hypothetical protein
MPLQIQLVKALRAAPLAGFSNEQCELVTNNQPTGLPRALVAAASKKRSRFVLPGN